MDTAGAPRLFYLTPARPGGPAASAHRRACPAIGSRGCPSPPLASLRPRGRFCRRSRSPGGLGAAREHWGDRRARSREPSRHVSVRGSPRRPPGPRSGELSGGSWRLRRCAHGVAIAGLPVPRSTARASRRRAPSSSRLPLEALSACAATLRHPGGAALGAPERKKMGEKVSEAREPMPRGCSGHGSRTPAYAAAASSSADASSAESSGSETLSEEGEPAGFPREPPPPPLPPPGGAPPSARPPAAWAPAARVVLERGVPAPPPPLPEGAVPAAPLDSSASQEEQDEEVGSGFLSLYPFFPLVSSTPWDSQLFFFGCAPWAGSARPRRGDGAQVLCLRAMGIDSSRPLCGLLISPVVLCVWRERHRHTNQVMLCFQNNASSKLLHVSYVLRFMSACEGHLPSLNSNLVSEVVLSSNAGRREV